MKFKSVTINNCYILGDQIYENSFFLFKEAKAVYSASVFHLGFLKADVDKIPQKILEQYEKSIIQLYRLNSPYLNIPFEINFHEERLYQSYYESDYFPMSLWFEEKSLIPYTIFLRVLKDILYGLRDLGKSGYSHQFLTPNEILIPLKYGKFSHAKLTNIGICNLAVNIMTDKEIRDYRNDYIRNHSKTDNNRSAFNMSEDLYSFGIIMNKLLLICDSTSDNKKEVIREKLDRFINNPDSFNSIDDAIEFLEDNLEEIQHIESRSEEYQNVNYSGRAAFNILEYEEWKEEAVLEPYQNETDLLEIEDEIVKKKKFSFYKNIATFISNFFIRTKDNYKRTQVTKNEKPLSGPPIENIKNNKSDSETIPVNKESLNIDKIDFIKDKPDKVQVSEILEQIQKHYNLTDTGEISNTADSKSGIKDGIHQKSEEHSKNKELQDFDKFDTSRTKLIYYSNKNIKVEENILNSNPDIYSKKQNDIVIAFKEDQKGKKYIRSYTIIDNSINGNMDLHNTINISELNNILNEKLKKLDDHYIANSSMDIIAKLEKLNTTQLSLQESPVDQEENLNMNSVAADNDSIKKEPGFFKRILLYLKAQFLKLTRKK